MKFKTLNSLIIFISLFYGVLVWLGLYGFGIDYYLAYNKANISWGGMFDQLGFRIASLSIYGHHFGVFIVTFLVSFSTGFTLLYYYSINNFNSKSKIIRFIAIYIFILHSWPVVMSNSNVMRQGLLMAFLYISIIAFEKQNYKIGWTTLVVMIFMHKSGIIFAFFIGLSKFLRKLKYLNLSTGLHKIVLVVSVFSTATTLFYAIPIYFGETEESRIISKDLSPLFILVNILYVVSYFLLMKKTKRNSITSQVLVMNSIITPVFFIFGFNWQYERLNMIVIVLYMLDISSFFPKLLRINYLILSSFCFMTLTIFAGLFSALN